MTDNPTEAMLPVTQADRDAAAKLSGVDISDGKRCRGTSRQIALYSASLQAFARHRLASQSEREAVLEEALLRCASRFSAYAELHAEKLWDGSLSEAQRQTVRDKVDRNLRYAAEARAALTTPAPAEVDALIHDSMSKDFRRVGEVAPAEPVSGDTVSTDKDERIAVLEVALEKAARDFETFARVYGVLTNEDRLRFIGAAELIRQALKGQSNAD